jgi:hypothetical protein
VRVSVLADLAGDATFVGLPIRQQHDGHDAVRSLRKRSRYWKPNPTHAEGAAGASTGFEWLRVRDQLADLYRRAGRNADARAVDSELLMLLAVADDDHPTKRRLASRQ